MATCRSTILHLRLSLICVLMILIPSQAARAEWQNGYYSERVSPNDGEVNGKTWAVLIAGSRGFGNYRHQADICHAYQILSRGGLDDENIIVFMYDDIAYHRANPRPGVIINNPKGDDVYAGVPKDYTGSNLTINNFFAVLLGDKDSLKGGSGKVLDSTSNDRVFIYYSDHGGAGSLGMPKGPLLYGKDFVEVLKKMHAARRYKEMVIYVEACESGSIFDGLLTDDLNIYVTTAANSSENSWATYCPYKGLGPPPPPGYQTCLGDLYSVSWMEDSDKEFSKKETLKTQYENVKLRTNRHNSSHGSHVMEYGNMTINSALVSLFQGNGASSLSTDTFEYAGTMDVVDQREADLIFLEQMYNHAGEGSEEKKEALKEITDVTNHRKHLDNSVDKIGVYLFGDKDGRSVLTSVRGQGMSVVDDWECLKSTVRVFETHCGSLTQYGMKHMRAFANICNRGIVEMKMEKACADVCRGYAMGQWDPAILGYSA